MALVDFSRELFLLFPPPPLLPRLVSVPHPSFSGSALPSVRTRKSVKGALTKRVLLTMYRVLGGLTASSSLGGLLLTAAVRMLLKERMKVVDLFLYGQVSIGDRC